MQLSHSLILVTENSNIAPHGKELSEDLKRHIVALYEDSQGYKKIANTLKLSCSTVAKIIQCFKRAGSTQNRPWVGHPKKLSACAECYIQMLSLKGRHRSPVSIAAEVKEVGVSLLVLRPYATLYIKLVCMAVTPGGGLFWRRYTRKPTNSLLKTCQQSAWITGTMSYGLMRWRLICLVLMASSMCGGDQVKSTKISVSCLQSSIVVGISWSKAAWVLQMLESYISLRETWTPICTVKYCCRAWSPPSRNWVAKQCSSRTMTPNTPPRWPLLYWSWPSMSPDLNPIEHLWRILKQKVEVCKVSNICQLRDVIMEEWKSIPVATCEALVNSMPRRVKAILDNGGDHTKYWQLTWCMLILTTFPKGCTHFCWQGFSF